MVVMMVVVVVAVAVVAVVVSEGDRDALFFSFIDGGEGGE